MSNRAAPLGATRATSTLRNTAAGGGLNLSGPGKLVLASDSNTYSGDTTVAGGATLVFVGVF